ncbi:MAG: hypothetical protein P8Y77_03315 [Nitrospirota bacterium]|jgi:hypothetical protein
MDITVHLSEREFNFLQKLMTQEKRISQEEYTLEDAIHECIRDSMFDEGEESAVEEFE